MNDWVNCLRFVAFGQTQAASGAHLSGSAQQAEAGAVSSSPACLAAASAALNKRAAPPPAASTATARDQLDVLLERRGQPAACGQKVSALSSGGGAAVSQKPPSQMDQRSIQTEAATQPQQQHQQLQPQPQVLTASQAAAAAASALARTRQRQPSLLGSCKPQPPTDSPFIKLTGSGVIVGASSLSNLNGATGQLDTLTPTVRGQLIAAAQPNKRPAQRGTGGVNMQAPSQVQATLDEEEENMLYCSIEDNPSEHNYRVKVIETELALRCQLKCYQLTAPKTISQQYEELAQFKLSEGGGAGQQGPMAAADQLTPLVTFYQLIIGPQELTLLNDYAACRASNVAPSQLNRTNKQQQGLWSWPYQCIRRYGFDKDNCFMFEAGRKCTSGPGQFIVQTPKAYNIYQDVVKFVNELRTITGSQPPVNASNGSKPPTATSVTQIPVTWTPGQMAEANNGAASRQQFFSQLSRHMDSTPPPGVTNPSTGEVTTASTTTATNTKLDELAEQKQQKGETTMEEVTTGANARLAGDEIEPTSHDDSRAKQPTVNVLESARKAGCNSSKAASQSSRLSSTSDETDESGYEQGDESVESAPTKRQPSQPAPLGKSAEAQNGTKPTTRLSAGSRLSANAPPATSCCGSTTSKGSSLGSSPSSSSSAGNSPGQSVSRRTGESIRQQQQEKQDHYSQPGNQFLIDTRLSLNKVGAHQNQPSVKTRAIQEIIAGDMLDETSRPDSMGDFETNLIRDVYSEITKLHAKFAVTSTGSGGDDSMSSDSRESSVAVSDDRASHRADEDEDEDEDEESNEDGCYYMNEPDERDEPMYSNLRPVSRSNQLANIRRETSQQGGNKRHSQSMPVDTTCNSLQRPFYRSHNQTNQPNLHITALAGNYELGRHHQPAPLSPQSQALIRPLYPTMLNPIPEINEQPGSTSQPSHSPRLSVVGHNHSTTKDSKERPDFPLRARLAVQREPIRRQKPKTTTRSTSTSGQRPVASCDPDKSKPTNHYVINDVQYAKISRNMAAPKFR